MQTRGPKRGPGFRGIEIAGAADFDQFYYVCVFFLWGKSYSLNVYLFFGDEKKTCFWIDDPWNFDSSKEFQLLDDSGIHRFSWETRVVHIFWGTGAHVLSCVFGNVLRGCW